MNLVVLLPIRTVSEANRASSEHWRVRYKRALSQRGTTKAIFAAFWRGAKMKLPVHVTLTRCAPSAGLDPDNLPTSTKHVQDGIADVLGVDDGDATKVTWAYQQERGPYAVRVEVNER